MSASRAFYIAGSILAALLFATACDGKPPAQPTGTTSLALQSQAPVWGGDAQPATTDVVRAAITPQQAKKIANACRNAPKELPNSAANTCANEIKVVIKLAKPCRPCKSVYIELARVLPGQAAQPDGFVVMRDRRPSHPLCPSHLDCQLFRLGVSDQVLQRVAAYAPPMATTSASTACPAPTDTTGSAPAGTACPAPTGTTSTTPTGTGGTTPAETTSTTPTGNGGTTPAETTSPTPTVAPVTSPASGTGP